MFLIYKVPFVWCTYFECMCRYLLIYVTYSEDCCVFIHTYNVYAMYRFSLLLCVWSNDTAEHSVDLADRSMACDSEMVSIVKWCWCDVELAKAWSQVGDLKESVYQTEARLSGSPAAGPDRREVRLHTSPVSGRLDVLRPVMDSSQNERPRMTLHDLSHSRNSTGFERRDQVADGPMKVAARRQTSNYASVFSADMKTDESRQRGDERLPLMIPATTTARAVSMTSMFIICCPVCQLWWSVCAESGRRETTKESCWKKIFKWRFLHVVSFNLLSDVLYQNFVTAGNRVRRTRRAEKPVGGVTRRDELQTRKADRESDEKSFMPFVQLTCPTSPHRMDESELFIAVCRGRVCVCVVYWWY